MITICHLHNTCLLQNNFFLIKLQKVKKFKIIKFLDSVSIEVQVLDNCSLGLTRKIFQCPLSTGNFYFRKQQKESAFQGITDSFSFISAWKQLSLIALKSHFKVTVISFVKIANLNFKKILIHN